MFRLRITHSLAPWLPQLAAAAFICLSLGTNTHVDAANTSEPSQTAAMANKIPGAELAQILPQNLQVLSLKDAEFYRAIFAAQKTGDLKTADKAIGKLTERRLLGHVLADRYKRTKPTLADLQAWLVAYADLPQADDIYEQAGNMPLPQGMVLTQPSSGDSWTGAEGYGSSVGFRSEANDNKASPTIRRFAAKIDHTLRHDDPPAAKALLDAEQTRRDMSMRERADLQGRIAASYFYDGQVTEARYLANEVSAGQSPLALWIGGLSAWKQGDMTGASEFFGKLAAQTGLSGWDRAAASFWAYRSLKRTGDTAQANYWLKQAALQPHSFYGYMATHLLGRDAQWSWDMPTLDKDDVAALTRLPAGWRSLALLQIGQTNLAESELRHLNPQGQRNLQGAMLALAEGAHMPTLAIQLGGIATNDNGRLYDAALYPVPPWQPEHGFQVDRALMYALMRHESQFNPTAVSGRGACGLMQLMPSTANLIANDNVADDECSGRMLEPAYNMALGQKYVRHLSEQSAIGDNLMLLLAAYNCGPNKVARWMDGRTRTDPLLFMESLPVRETRDYVQQVLIQYWGYRARLGEPETSLTQLAHGEWPRYTLHDETINAKRIKEASLDGFTAASLKR